MSDATPSVLIVDDDRGMLRLIEKTLRREGYATATAASGGEALNWLKKNCPSLMLLDLKLQDMEGTAIINQLVAMGVSVPFVIITGQGDERVAVEMMKRGALDYLVKDVQFQEFVPTVVRRALERLDRDRRLAAAEDERERLQQQLLEVGEGERRRIGQDLHDGLGQHLTGIELMMQALAEDIRTFSKRDAEQVEKITGHLRDAIRQSKALARGLSPVELQSEGLMSALDDLASNVSALFRVNCIFHCASPVLVSDNTSATHLFRIAQEATTNAVKHGRARRIEIDLACDADRLTLSVLDDGKGIKPGESRQNGMGLSTMKYRAQLIGGTLFVGVGRTGGTAVTCVAPRSLCEETSK